MAWIETHQSLLTHRKTLALADALEIKPVYALGHLVSLWLWCLDNAPSGALERVTPRMVAMAAQWDSDPAIFLNALVESGFIDEGEGGFTIHDWAEYAGRLIEKRRSDADRKRVQRTSSGHPADVPRDGAGTVPNRTLPDLTVPDQSNTNVDPDSAVVAPSAPPRKIKMPKVLKNPSVSEDFVDAEIAKYEGFWPPGEVRDRIAAALNHEASDKWKNAEIGVRNWLARDAEKVKAIRASGRNGRNGQHNTPQGLRDLSEFDRFG